MTGFRHGRSRVGALSLALVGALLLATGCATKPSYNYVANTKTKTYFKVPDDWNSTDTHDEDYAFAQIFFGVEHEDSQAFLDFKKVHWSVEYNSPFDTKANLDRPYTYGLVTPVPPYPQNNISLDALRNLLAPVTQAAQARMLSQRGSLPRAFEVLDDEMLTPEPGLRGVRVVFNQVDDGDPYNVLRTRDLTILTNNDASVVYLLLVWCSAQCYRKNAVQINDVVTSFTVRSAP